MPCFCGPDLRTLVVTSLRTGSIAAQVDQFPALGGLFIAAAAVAGSPVSRMPL
jgi:sugar lactone lactonase YvrE